MERRQAVTAATAASITFLLGAAGLTANAAILGGQKAGGVGQISPVPTAVKPAKVAKLDTVTTTAVPTTAAVPTPTATPTLPPVNSVAPVAPSPGSGLRSSSPGGSVSYPQSSGIGTTQQSHASAPAPAASTAPAHTSTGGSPVATGGEESAEHEEAEHEEEHEEVEHESTEGSEDDD